MPKGDRFVGGLGMEVRQLLRADVVDSVAVQDGDYLIPGLCVVDAQDFPVLVWVWNSPERVRVMMRVFAVALVLVVVMMICS